MRRWPAEHPTPRRLEWIHDKLLRAAGCGIDFLPVPHRTRHGKTYVVEGGSLWELTDWLPGVADFHKRPTDHRLESAMLAIASRSPRRERSSRPSLRGSLSQICRAASQGGSSATS